MSKLVNYSQTYLKLSRLRVAFTKPPLKCAAEMRRVSGKKTWLAYPDIRKLFNHFRSVPVISFQECTFFFKVLHSPVVLIVCWMSTKATNWGRWSYFSKGLKPSTEVALPPLLCLVWGVPTLETWRWTRIAMMRMSFALALRFCCGLGWTGWNGWVE